MAFVDAWPIKDYLLYVSWVANPKMAGCYKEVSFNGVVTQDMVDRALVLQVREARERAKAARQKAQEFRTRAEMLTADAERLLRRFDELDRAVLARAMRGQMQEVPNGNSSRDLALHQLKNSLQQLETLHMIPANDPRLHKLKTDMRKTIRRAGKRAEE